MEHISTQLGKSTQLSKVTQNEETNGDASKSNILATSPGAALNWKNESEDWRELNREEHHLACEEAQALIDIAYGRTRTELDKRVSAKGLGLCLAEVPPGEIVQLAKDVLASRTNPYPPKGPDLLAFWKGEEMIVSEDEKGQEKVERVTVANVRAYTTLAPTRNELIAKGLLDPDAPTPPGVAPSGPEGNGAPALPPEYFSAEAAKARRARIEAEKDDERINRALWEQCNMKTFAVPREMRMEFGRWFLARFPLDEWTPELAKEQWYRWQEEKQNTEE